jgi:phosphohistidine phosphatase
MHESTSGETRTLVVMRHSKAEPGGQSDHERALADRGRGDAAEAGRWLQRQGIVVDAALVSDALRTRETWAELATGAEWDVDPDFSSALYAAGPDSTFDLIRETPADVQSLVVVGHNPTMAYLAELIDDGEGDDDAITELVTRGFPTSALVVFSVAGPWSDLGPGSGVVRLFHVGGS